MTPSRSNIVLIGMPGSGKSTVGVILAKRSAHHFVDTDVLIQTAQGRTLQEIADHHGYQALRRVEQEVLLALEVRGHVIATGGSAVYSAPAMAYLTSRGVVVFLDVELPTLLERVTDFDTRGIAKRPGQSFAELYAERRPLYRQYADVTVDASRLTQEAVCREIEKQLTELSPPRTA